MIRALLLASCSTLAVATGAHAQSPCTMPHILQNGTVADASQVMDNLNTLNGCVTALPGQIIQWANPTAPPFNASGNGVADNTTAIQQAINSISGTGGRVMLPPGHFCVKSGPLTVTTKAIVLQGGSRQGSQFSITGEDLSKGTVLDACGADVSIITMSADSDGLRNIHIMGSNTPTTTKPTVLLNSGCNECKIDDSQIQLGQIGVSAVGAGEIYIRNTTVDTAYGRYMVYLQGTGGYIRQGKFDQAYPAGTPVGMIPAPSGWAATTSYATGTLVNVGAGCPLSDPCYLLQAMIGGTSGSSTPVIPAYGVNLVDGTVTWQLSSNRFYSALGIDTGSGGNLLVDNTDFSNNANTPILIENTLAGNAPNYITLGPNLTIAQYLQNGIAMSSGYGVQIVGNQFGRCLITNCGPISAFVGFAGDAIIANNEVTGVFNTGVFVGAGQRTVINSNHFGVGTTGVSIAANVHDFTVEGNVFGSAIWGNTTNAITVATGSSDYYFITGNTCNGSTTGVQDFGSGTHKTVQTGGPC